MTGGWVGDFWLGIRLAVGGGRITRTALIRLVLTTVGVGLATAILLAAASMGHAISASQGRQDAQFPVTEPRAGVAALYEAGWDTQADDGTLISGDIVYASGPNAPVPPGLERIPGPGEMVASPALHRLLTSPEGHYLRKRFPGRIVGEIGDAGLVRPDKLTFWIGAGPELQGDVSEPVYGFGDPPGHGPPLGPGLIALIVVGVTILLAPVFAFVVTVSRIAGAERDRRLSALRLAGCGAAQVRRIAAAESLVGAVAGMGLGAGLFLLARALVGGESFLGFSFFASDITPPWPLVILVALLVPALAVGAALFAQRRTVIEPLGVFRDVKPVRRRVSWRFAVLAVGIAALAGAGTLDRGGDLWSLLLVAGTLGILVGVAVLLPWLVERVVRRLRGGRPSWQLAVRRLQLDSGTASRVVAGLAVVLAGAVALQSMLLVLTSPAAAQQQYRATGDVQTVQVSDELAPRVGDRLARVPGVSGGHAVRFLSGQRPDAPPHSGFLSIAVADCATVTWVFRTDSCHDGQVFRNDSGAARIGVRGDLAHRAIALTEFRNDSVHTVSTYRVPGDPVSVRPRVRLGNRTRLSGTPLVVTPGAVRGVALPESSAFVLLRFDAANRAVRHEIYAALAPFGWHASMYVPQLQDLADPGTVSTRDRRTAQIRDALLAGSLFVLLLAGTSLLVLASEQVRERRRSLAALAASGVPRPVLARSLLWQTAIPVVLGTVSACVGGAVLAALVLSVSGQHVVVDWQSMGMFAAGALVLTVLVTAGALPLLRGVARVESLRTE